MNSRRHPRCSFAAEELAAIFLAQATLSNCALRSSGSIFRKWTMSSSNATVPALFQASKRLRVDAGMSAGCIQPGEPSSESQDEVMKSSVLVEKTSGVGGFPVKTPDLYPLPGFEPPPLPQGSQHDSELAIKASEEAVSSQVEPAELTLEQKMRMETNKTIAQAKRNIRACQLHIAEAKKAGKFPGFAELLVEQSWADVLHGEFSKPYMRKLHLFIEQEVSGKFPVYPPLHLVFNAFNTCPFGKVKVVIIGQDPYHGPGQAMGLSFSVPQGTKIPSSLVNIFKEIRDDVGSTIPSHGNLEKWAHQGVLMLNAVLTVRERHANSHSKKGWEPFTDAAIRLVSQKRKGVVFLLWGNSACDKIRLIDTTQHHILKTAHPSGLSAHKGFFSCRHFSKANEILVKAGRLPIDWQL